MSEVCWNSLSGSIDEDSCIHVGFPINIELTLTAHVWAVLNSSQKHETILVRDDFEQKLYIHKISIITL